MKTAKRTNLPEDWRRARELKHICVKSLKQAKRDFITDNLKDPSQDPKKFWEIVNSILPNSGNKKVVDLIDKDTGSPIHPENVAEYVNEFFTGIGPKLASKFTDPSANDMQINLRNKVFCLGLSLDQNTKTCLSSCTSSFNKMFSTRLNREPFLKHGSALKLSPSTRVVMPLMLRITDQSPCYLYQGNYWNKLCIRG